MKYSRISVARSGLGHENWFQSKVVSAGQGKVCTLGILVLYMGSLGSAFSSCYFIFDF